MKEEIKAWLQGPREFNSGVRLYELYGFNKVLKNNFAKGETENSRASLEYELGQLIGLDTDDIKNMPRKAVSAKKVVKEEVKTVTPPRPYLDDLLLALGTQLNVTVDQLFADVPVEGLTEDQQKAVEEIRPAYSVVPETMKKVIRIREKYPFLKEESCPAEIKLMLHDMFSAYDRYRDAHAKLSPENSIDQNLVLAGEVVENYLDNRMMWEELDYYKEHNALLGNHPIFETVKLREEIKALTDIQLVQKQNTVKSNLTKSKKAIEKAGDQQPALSVAQERLEKWLQVKAEVDAELARRGK